jgi:uncharacterized protein YecT (DUF1311 family)
MTNGLEAAPAADPAPAIAAQSPPETRAERLRRSAPLIGGFAVAAVLGAGLGAFALQGRNMSGPVAVSTPAEVAAARDGGVQVEVAAVKPMPIPVSTGKLEVLPPGLAAAAPAPPPPVQRAAAADVGEDADATAPMPAPIRMGDPTPARCAGAQSMAEDMVCEDASLAAADRRLNRAYRAALDSGAMPPGELRAEQQDWLSVREEAAHRSIRAVDSVYRQRIAELEAMAPRD